MPPAPATARVNVPGAVTVTGFIALLKVALTAALSGIFKLALAGLVRIMFGEVASGPAPVVKLHTKFAANALPLRSSAAVVILAVNSVFAAKALAGWKVAVVPA